MPKETYQSYGTYAQKWAKRQRSGENVSHEYLEKPAMMAALGDIKGKDVLCLGCGTGEECRKLKDLGAHRVVGIDRQAELIELAKQEYSDIEFDVMPMEAVNFPEGTFDLVYSSLVMHYSPDWSVPLAQVKKVLKEGGKFLFSTHHPVWWGAEKVRDQEKHTTRLGATRTGNDKFEIYGDYLNDRQIDDIWFNELKVTFYHKSFSQILTYIIESGFQIKKFIEPKATEGAKAKKYNFWAVHQKIPFFMIFELQK